MELEYSSHQALALTASVREGDPVGYATMLSFPFPNHLRAGDRQPSAALPPELWRTSLAHHASPWMALLPFSQPWSLVTKHGWLYMAFLTCFLFMWLQNVLSLHTHVLTTHDWNQYCMLFRQWAMYKWGNIRWVAKSKKNTPWSLTANSLHLTDLLFPGTSRDRPRRAVGKTVVVIST